MNLPKNPWLLPIVAIIGLLISIAWIAGMFNHKIAPGLADLPAAQTTADIVLAIREEMPAFEHISANLSAKQATLISSRVLARITKIHVRAGDTVTAGQPLIELERQDFLSRQSQAEQQLKSIDARLLEATNNLERITTLQQRGVVAVAELDRATANVNSLQADLQAAQKRVQEAKTTVEFTSIKSPIDGRIVDRFAEPGDTASPGIKLLTLYNPLTLRAEGNVREQLALQLKTGQSLTLEIPSLNLMQTAILEEVVPAADPASRSFQIKAGIDYQPELLPGLYARLHIPSGTTTRILIPSDRIARIGQLDIVWVLTDKRVETRYVKTGKQINREGRLMTDIISGINAGDKILPVPME